MIYTIKLESGKTIFFLLPCKVEFCLDQNNLKEFSRDHSEDAAYDALSQFAQWSQRRSHLKQTNDGQIKMHTSENRHDISLTDFCQPGAKNLM